MNQKSMLNLNPTLRHEFAQWRSNNLKKKGTAKKHGFKGILDLENPRMDCAQYLI